MLLKVCGLKYPENIKQVAQLKPDFMGFIFYPESKRFVGDDFIMPAISPEIKKVGVFVNAPVSYIIDKVDEYKLDLIQLHGDESPAYCEVLNHVIPVIKAFGVDEVFDFKILTPYEKVCSYFLFDTKTKEYGGSGKQFDWAYLEKYDSILPFFLSGGIGQEEIKKVQGSTFKVLSVDVNSKFEIEPGLKDIEKLKKIKHELSS
jgi:phosphoribosylanthranilate isomerase